MLLYKILLYYIILSLLFIIYYLLFIIYYDVFIKLQSMDSRGRSLLNMKII
jgi:hypothetical protein